MAGSPGAGKTEASLALIEAVNSLIIRIDPDEYRIIFPDYTGCNSFLFQGAVSILVDRIHDLALSQSQSFVLDGTLANFDAAEKNISRSVSRGRPVQILYVHQDPLQAWQFVQARELMEGRMIPLEDFVHQYYSALETVNRLKGLFGPAIKVDVLLKNIDGSERTYDANVARIDRPGKRWEDRNALRTALERL